VTDKDSILNIDRIIRKDFPPIGGVVNGAMILADQLFSKMSLENWQRTIKPKVDGSILLNDLYAGNDLDFFILMGSIAGPLGNRSQSSYAAANTFMSSIIRWRRDRNLAGSIINPGQILNVGYVLNADSWLVKSLVNSIGCYSMSEQDLHELFAEGILAGRPDSGRNPDIIAGFKSESPTEKPNVIWYRNPKTWHYVVHCMENGTSSPTAGVPVKLQLESASSHRDVMEIVEAGFIAKIRSKLQLSDEDTVAREVAPVELGVDSLIAVDLRTWFVKETGVDIPILKILGGFSIS
jgi:KR domain-containing protein